MSEKTTTGVFGIKSFGSKTSSMSSKMPSARKSSSPDRKSDKDSDLESGRRSSLGSRLFSAFRRREEGSKYESTTLVDAIPESPMSGKKGLTLDSLASGKSEVFDNKNGGRGSDDLPGMSSFPSSPSSDSVGRNSAGMANVRASVGGGVFNQVVHGIGDVLGHGRHGGTSLAKSKPSVRESVGSVARDTKSSVAFHGKVQSTVESSEEEEFDQEKDVEMPAESRNKLLTNIANVLSHESLCTQLAVQLATKIHDARSNRKATGENDNWADSSVSLKIGHNNIRSPPGHVPDSIKKTPVSVRAIRGLVLDWFEEEWCMPKKTFRPVLTRVIRRKAGHLSDRLPETITFDQFEIIIPMFLRRVRDALSKVKIDRTWFIKNRANKLTDMYDPPKSGDELGRGNFGVTKLIRHRFSRAERVCKTMDKTILGGVPNEEVERELGMLTNLDHPHIVRVYESFEDFQQIHIVMDYARGGDLAGALKSAKSDGNVGMDPVWLKYAMRQAYSGLAYIHAREVMHCDVKPANLLLLEPPDPMKKPHVVLADFGLSDFCQSAADGAGAGGGFRGTPAYAAPEAFEGVHKLCTKTDVWGMAVVCWELICGQKPYQGNNLMQLAMMVSRREPKWDQLEKADCPQEIKDFLKKVLIKKIETRPSAADCVTDSWLSSPDPPEKSWEKNSVGLTRKDLIANITREKSVVYRTVMAAVAANVSVGILEEANELFLDLNTSGSGGMTQEEFVTGLLWKVPGYEDGDEEKARARLIKMFEETDANQNETIDYTEFLAAAVNLKSLDTDNVLLAVFNLFDLNETGYITMKELMMMLSGGGQMGVDDVIGGVNIEDVMRDIAGDSEMISFSQFKQYLLRQEEGEDGFQRDRRVSFIAKQMAQTFETFDDWYRETPAQQAAINPWTLMYKDNDDLEHFYVMLHLPRTLWAVRLFSVLSSAYWVYAATFADMFAEIDPMWLKWDNDVLVAHNLGLIIVCSLSFFMFIYSQACLRGWCRYSVMTEYMICVWAVFCTAVSICLCNRWRVANIFGTYDREEYSIDEIMDQMRVDMTAPLTLDSSDRIPTNIAEKYFPRGYNYDDDLLLSIVGILAFFSMISDVRFVLLFPMASAAGFTYWITSFLLDVPESGVPGGSENNGFFGAACMLCGVCLCLLWGKSRVEKRAREQFMALYKSYTSLKKLSMDKNAKKKNRVRAISGDHDQLVEVLDQAQETLGALHDHPRVQALRLTTQVETVQNAVDLAKTNLKWNGKKTDLADIIGKDLPAHMRSAIRDCLNERVRPWASIARDRRVLADENGGPRGKSFTQRNLDHVGDVALDPEHAYAIREELPIDFSEIELTVNTDGPEGYNLYEIGREWTFDMLGLSKDSGGNALLYVGERLIVPILTQKYGLQHEEDARRFVLLVHAHHRRLYFHNECFAAHTFHAVRYIADAVQLWDAMTDAEEQFAFVIAAFCLNVGHMGVDDAALHKSQHPILSLYSGDVQCQIHNCIIKSIWEESNLPPLSDEVKSAVSDLVMSADLPSAFENCKILAMRVKTGKFSINNRKDRECLSSLVFAAAELSWYALPWFKDGTTEPCHVAWGLRMANDMDRSYSVLQKKGVVLSEYHLAIGEFCALPLFEALQRVVTDSFMGGKDDQIMSRMANEIMKNAQQWQIYSDPEPSIQASLWGMNMHLPKDKICVAPYDLKQGIPELVSAAWAIQQSNVPFPQLKMKLG